MQRGLNKNIIRCKKGILKVYYKCITFNPHNIEKSNINEYYFKLLMDAVNQGKLIQYNDLKNVLTFDTKYTTKNEPNN